MGESRGQVMIWGYGPVFVPLSALPSQGPGLSGKALVSWQGMWGSHCPRKLPAHQRDGMEP